MSLKNSQLKPKQERGRPMDLSRNKVILEATLTLLTQIGYTSLTMDAIAKQAKVSKASIYRRWPSKEELVLESVKSINPFENMLEKMDIRESCKSLREQLINLLCCCLDDKNDLYHYILAALASGIPSNKDCEKDLLMDFYKNFRLAINSIVKPFLKNNAKLKEELLNLLADVVPSLISFRVFLLKEKFNTSYIVGIVDNIMIPMIQPYIY